MKFLQLIGLDGLGLKVAVIAIAVAITDALLKKFSKRVPRFIVNYLPLLMAAVGVIIAELIVNKSAELAEESFYEALMAYSFGTVISVAVRKILRGENVDDALLMLVQGVAENLCGENAGEEFMEIVKILTDFNETDDAFISLEIASILKKAAKDGVSDADINAAAEIILLSAKNFIKEK